MDKYFINHLAKQIRFLETSCAAFDSGDREEAVRLATIMRLLFHDRGRSISLLTHLKVKDCLQLYTSARDLDPNVGFADLLTRWGSEPTSKLTIDLESSGGSGRYVPASYWWDQLVYVNNDIKITKGALVRFAADKDGGAHVDAVQDSSYIALQAMWQSCSSDGSVMPVDVTRLGLRTLAFELLSSPELLGLARST